ncbi:MarR family transcriptional regulator [Ideonella sp. B7]|uniref:MarR family winged helix-turn-helix transcriptional regulator n=1 Tax=Ideonella benzenivorans TaxID=2831643 RepID=UPI001CED82FD|nr:MarR family transcriptional regulator [Ideonella benzenivorans]MCA6215913.1 MarR family transcriptional regulator [Ideonella benzenivorans]
MPTAESKRDEARDELANRLFFKLYQCANLLHKTGTRAVESEGLTTQQWAVLGALSLPESAQGRSVGDLARYLLVSRQNLAGVIGRLERDGRIRIDPDPNDRRARLIRLTEAGQAVWHQQAQPKIHAFYEAATTDFSFGDLIHTTHYLMKLLENMQQLDQGSGEDEPDDGGA